MLLRFVKHWLGHRPGDEYDHPFPGQAQMLVQRGYAIRVSDRPDSIPIDSETREQETPVVTLPPENVVIEGVVSLGENLPASDETPKGKPSKGKTPKAR